MNKYHVKMLSVLLNLKSHLSIPASFPVCLEAWKAYKHLGLCLPDYLKKPKKKVKVFCQIQKHCFVLSKLTELGGPSIGFFVCFEYHQEGEDNKNHHIFFLLVQMLVVFL